VCLIGYLGIDSCGITPRIASFSVCIGLAVNGALSNLAGGVLILLTRPFRVDDFIEAQGVSGTVADIHITSTKIVTGDNKVIYVPNGTLANGNIINYSEKDTRRVDLEFSISYSADSEKAKAIIADIFEKHELILKDPAPFIRLTQMADSSLNFTIRVGTESANYWAVTFDLNEGVVAELQKNGIEIPFPQLDVHVKKED
jgi:small conductance mechanosensitive channel